MSSNSQEIKRDYKRRYYLFTCSEYYPVGGLDDVEATFDTIEEALNYKPDYFSDFNTLWDRIEAEIIKEW
jgi:hypothetical protein